MSDTTASFDDVTLFGGRGFAFGDVCGLLGNALHGLALGGGAVAAVGASAAAVTLTGLWVVGHTLSSPPHLQAREPAGPARLALAGPAAFPKSSFEVKWALSTADFGASAGLAARPVEIAERESAVSTPVATLHPEPKVKLEVGQAPPLSRVARPSPPVPALPSHDRPGSEARKRVVIARVAATPLPRPNPQRHTIAQTPVEKSAPRIAAVTTVPAVESRIAPPEAPARTPVLSGPPGRTALYDITGQVVYMPDGERLEAHSGLGHLRDDPRYIKVKNRGPTPPNVYKLTLRESLFHGVRAVRMTPVDETRMFGRDGMLAHSYMLGATGQSNGCVSFKNYDRFLQAFLKGEVDRIVVVRKLDDAPRQLAGLARGGSQDGNRYAANEVTGSTW